MTELLEGMVVEQGGKTRNTFSIPHSSFFELIHVAQCAVPGQEKRTKLLEVLRFEDWKKDGMADAPFDFHYQNPQNIRAGRKYGKISQMEDM